MDRDWKKFKIMLNVPAVYKPGEWRISRLIIGPRGGQSWERVTHGISATGGWKTLWLSAGTYKETWWSNGWPHSRRFRVTEQGEVEDL